MKRYPGLGIFLAGLFLVISPASNAVVDNPRNAAASPGDVEVIAGTGYQHTLFDSADNKCQHCHNDLYDTWKTSMHAKSWKDPIFQSKYQDFLRLQASKIGAKGPTGIYEESTIQKSSQVCIKCHAPTAYYSGDYQVIVSEVGDVNNDPNAYDDAKALETNLAPSFNPANEAIVSSMSREGKVYTVNYHIGHSHNREGINCAFCHSLETVRMMNSEDGDGGQYQLLKPIKQGPIGPVVRNAGDTLLYSADASQPDMNAFFALIGPEKYKDFGNTPKDLGSFDGDAKAADGRYTMKSIPHADPTEDPDCGEIGYYTGGPFYGPFGVTGLSNSNGECDLTDRAALVNRHFVDAVEAADGDKFTSEHQFAAYGKALCLSCHQRSSLMVNPESNGVPGLQIDPDNPHSNQDQFLELCSTWTAMSDGVGDNYQDSKTSPKCQRCHMEPLAGKTVLHKWNSPDELFTAEDGVTKHFDPESNEGPVAEGYLNNHAFMGANTADFGLVKIQSGFSSSMSANKQGDRVRVRTRLQNRTAHMFPGAHPMRRVLTRVVVTDANGNKIPFESASGDSSFKSVSNKLAVLEGDEIMPGFKAVRVKYDSDRNLVFQGQTPNLDDDVVMSQMMAGDLIDWVSPDATVVDCPDVPKGPVETSNGWVIKGCTTVKKITDIAGPVDHFTRVYGRETGKRAPDGTHVVRPGFDSNIATDNRLEPNEREKYEIYYNTADVTAWPVTVKYKVYYLKKGGSGKFPTGADGFLNTDLPPETLKKLAIFEVYDKEVVIKPREKRGHGHGHR